MAGPRGYNSYRGRLSLWKIALGTVLVLVILSSCAVIYLQQHIVYDENGIPQLPFGLPWLTEEERAFATLTCRHSGTENGMMIRALHTGNPEEDPGWSRNLPEKFEEEDGIRTAWCDLYYDISYHISDKSSATVQERDACVGGMMNAVSAFWQETDLDTLLTMTEDDVVRQFNAWAEEASTENVKINSVTADDIHFEPYDERGINYN